MKRIILIIIVAIMALGCKNDPIPSDAIPRDKFVDILVDVHIAEAMTKEQFRLKIDSLQSSSMYLSVLNKYGVTDNEMLVTSLYYSRHQKEYKKIYTDVLDKLSMLIENEKSSEGVQVSIDSISDQQMKKVNSIQPEL